MKIEIFDYRLECRTYEIKDGLARVLVDKSRTNGEVWGFDEEQKQYEGRLIDVDTNVVILA